MAEAWQPIDTAPKDGSKIWLHFPGEAEPVRLGSWIDRELREHGEVVSTEIGWLMADRAELRDPDDPADWCAAPPPPSAA
ncbi:MAG TPA: hypothetical protein VGF07_02040 [Stellaceae bacterium]|jgi:hypothetical protein